MLLVHQTGSLKLGEVVRYTLTYTPSEDRILPTPSILHLKIKNSSPIPLRAAYLHGPYTLYVSAYPSTFHPNHKLESPRRVGIPQFEPNLKAGGSWTARLKVPDSIREGTDRSDEETSVEEQAESVTWIIEVSSQTIFSTSAAVNFELLVGRDAKSVDLGFAGYAAGGSAGAGRVEDHQQGRRSNEGHHPAQPKGVFSKAVKLVVDDTASLWNKPALPKWDTMDKVKEKTQEYPDPGDQDVTGGAGERSSGKDTEAKPNHKNSKQKKIHLVVLTHGLHSNIGADMLYLKESIDAAAKQAREDARKRRALHRERERQRRVSASFKVGPKDIPGLEEAQPEDDLYKDEDASGDESEDEEVIVRGFTGNAGRTERGIQHLGKRLAKYILSITYPDQPFLPVKKSVGTKISKSFSGQPAGDRKSGTPAHTHSSIHHKSSEGKKKLPYKITSISFIAHSLGGLTQTYAIAYIHKHSPHFFKEIKPVNFIAMATPFLGLSNENPIYVKFALDFGLVGRTGQDLGLTWRTPTLARSGWGALVGGLGSGTVKGHQQADPGSKPLLRILPNGPAHHALKLFRNRTVYSNVVNDGIVPLRTSCLLFLDWRGLGRVDKARRENGLVGTALEWGWAELTGTNASSANPDNSWVDEDGSISTNEENNDDTNTPTAVGEGDTVPQPSDNATQVDTSYQAGKSPKIRQSAEDQEEAASDNQENNPPEQSPSALNSFLSLFRSRPVEPRPSRRSMRMYKRSQTRDFGNDDTSTDGANDDSSIHGGQSAADRRPSAIRGSSIVNNPEDLLTPPKTSFFESAGDVLNPPLPGTDFLIDPSRRPRTIFHDRVYHPQDIPPAPIKRRTGLGRSYSQDSTKRTNTDFESRNRNAPPGAMKVEEKIARAYHRDLSWRKVLVRLEPDAHNNMVVRRMFSNAYGWPVIKHLVDTHFADTYVAITADDEEPGQERAKPMDKAVSKTGEEVNERPAENDPPHGRSISEVRESRDHVHDLKSPTESSYASSAVARSFRSRGSTRENSSVWSDSVFETATDDEDEEDENGANQAQAGNMWNFWSSTTSPAPAPASASASASASSPRRPRHSSASSYHPHNLASLSISDRTGDEDPAHPRGTSQAEIADFLTASPSREGTSLPKEGTSSNDGTDAPSQQSNQETPQPLLSPSSPPANVGLHAPVLGGEDKASEEDGGVAERVARTVGSVSGGPYHSPSVSGPSE
ncbi:MAG: hypothetical protein M1819_001657 [Sarea resinae]|nr:MAG: hypothetical protein M1819_001657 [Sarea resinae]